MSVSSLVNPSNTAPLVVSSAMSSAARQAVLPSSSTLVSHPGALAVGASEKSLPNILYRQQDAANPAFIEFRRLVEIEHYIDEKAKEYREILKSQAGTSDDRTVPIEPILNREDFTRYSLDIQKRLFRATMAGGFFGNRKGEDVTLSRAQETEDKFSDGEKESCLIVDLLFKEAFKKLPKDVQFNLCDCFRGLEGCKSIDELPDHHTVRIAIMQSVAPKSIDFETFLQHLAALEQSRTKGSEGSKESSSCWDSIINCFKNFLQQLKSFFCWYCEEV